MGSSENDYTICDIDTGMFNPFRATAEELLAVAMDDAGLLRPTTTINGVSAKVILLSYFQKRSAYQEITMLGSMLVKQGILTDGQLAEALQLQRSSDGMKLGDALVALGICTLGEIEESLDAQVRIRREMEDMESFRDKIDAIKMRLQKYF